MVEVSNNFIQECEANVGAYKFGKIKVNYIDDNPLNYEQGAYSSIDGTKIDAEQSIRYNKLVECKPNFKYKIELGNSAYKMKIVTYNANQAFIAVHDNLAEGSELTTESTAAYISVTIYSNDTLEGTNITLNNTIRNSEISGAELKGNTTQDGTPIPSSPVPVNNVTGEQIVRVCGKNLIEIERQTTTQGGLTFTINEDKSVSVTGTFSSSVYFSLFNSKKAINPSTTYTLSGAVSPSARLRIRLFNQSQTQLSEYYLSNKNGYTFTTPSNAYYYDLYIVMYAVNEGDVFYPQLEVGSVMTEYEPQTNKDYEINLGKNLLQYSNFSNRTESGITITNNNDGTFLVNGTATANVSLAIDPDNFMPMKGTWRITGCPSGGSSSTYMLSAYVGYWGGGSPNIDTGNGTSITYTGNVKVRFYIKNGTTCDNLLFKPMVTYDLNATYEDFAPYFEPIELNKIGDYQDFIRKGTGKNLFDLENAYHGTINASGVVGPNEQFRTSDYISTKPSQKYYFSSIAISGQTNKQIYIAYYNSNKEFLSRDSYNAYESVFTTPTNCYYMRAGVYTQGQTQIMLEQGNTKTLYEPYGYGDKWYIEKNVGKVVLNGSENGWSYPSANRFNLDNYVSDYLKKNNDVTYVCDSYIGYDQKPANADFNTLVANVNYGFDFGSGNAFNIRIKDIRYTSIADFKSSLQTNNVTLYYVLANPTYTLIENEELIEQLDAVNHAETQEGTTNITSSGILPAILEVTPNLIESIRGKQTTPIVGYNITGDDDLINFKITSKADSNGNILGATSQSQVDIEIFNENNTHNLENKQVYISTGLNETEGNYCKWQPFTITQTKDTQTKNHTTYTGYDDMMRGNEAYIDNVNYGEEGITLYDFTCKLAKEMGMALGNTTMTNGDFIVKGNNFTNNEAKLVVLKNVAQMAGGFAMIDRDNLLRIVELSPEDAMTPIELTTNLYTEDFQNSAKFGEINEFAIGETNIETNAIVRSDDASIAKNGVKKIEILDNMFLGLLEDKEIAIEPLWDAFNGFSYYPFKTPYNGYPYIDLGDKINITDINSNIYGTLVLNNVFEYNGGYKGNIGAEALSITAAKYKTNNTLGKQFRKVGIEIDRVEGKITSEIAAATDGITNAYNTAISQTEKNINLSVTEINKVLSGNPAVEGDTGLEGTVNKINQTYLTVDSSDFTVVSSTATEAKKKADAVEENTQKIVSQLHFDAETGLTISAEGSTDDDMKLNLTNSQVNFMYRNSPVLVINGNKIEFTGATFQKFDLGNYVWQAEDDDSLSLIYEGD